MRNINLTIIVTLVFSGLLMLAPKPATADAVIALDDQLKDYWVVEGKVAPRYPKMALRRGISGCAAVGYIIEADGSTSDHKVLAYYPSTIFDKTAIKAAEQFTYRPSVHNADKISALTLNVFTYQISNGKKEFDSETRKKLSEICTTAGKKSFEPHISNTDSADSE